VSSQRDLTGSLRADSSLLPRVLPRRHRPDRPTALDTLDHALAPYFSSTGDSIEFINPSPTLLAAVQNVANEAVTVDEAVTSALTATDMANRSAPAIATDVRDHIQRLMFDINVIQRLVGR
jgi:hypothetical protein